jgi:hypothetical protein
MHSRTANKMLQVRLCISLNLMRSTQHIYEICYPRIWRGIAGVPWPVAVHPDQGRFLRRRSFFVRRNIGWWGGDGVALGCEAARWLATEPSWTRSASFGPGYGCAASGGGGWPKLGEVGWRRAFLSVAVGASRASSLMGSGLGRARRA